MTQPATTSSSTAQPMVRVRYRAETASGHRAGWARVVTGVTDTVSGAKSFIGYYLRDGVQVDLPAGTVVLEVFPRGSAKHGWQEARFLRVTAKPDGGDLEVLPGEWDWRDDFLDIRDRARDLLVEQQAAAAGENDVARAPTDPAPSMPVGTRHADCLGAALSRHAAPLAVRLAFGRWAVGQATVEDLVVLVPWCWVALQAAMPAEDEHGTSVKQALELGTVQVLAMLAVPPANGGARG
jgi:hypothetical protein